MNPIPKDNQHFPDSGDLMISGVSAADVRPARCSIRETAAFLRDLRTIAGAHDTHIICFNADLVAGRIHAATAVARAVRARHEGRAVSNGLEMESFLFAAGSRQCSVASSFGVHMGENRLFVCCYPIREGIWTDLETLFSFTSENWDEIDPEKRARLMTFFGITEEEIAAAGGEERLLDLVLERVVLSEVNR